MDHAQLGKEVKKMAKKAKKYRVWWVIDVYAGSLRQAAEAALQIQRDAESPATCFDVGEFKSDVELMELHEIDLSKGRAR